MKAIKVVKKNNATQKLNGLVKDRKTKIVIYEKGSIKSSSKSSNNSSVESYSYSNYE